MERAMAPHSSTLAWKIPWTEEPGRLQSMGSLRVGHDWATSLSLWINSAMFSSSICIVLCFTFKSLDTFRAYFYIWCDAFNCIFFQKTTQLCEYLFKKIVCLCPGVGGPSLLCIKFPYVLGSLSGHLTLSYCTSLSASSCASIILF